MCNNVSRCVTIFLVGSHAAAVVARRRELIQEGILSPLSFQRYD